MTNPIIENCRRTGRTKRTVEQLIDAYTRAELKGPLTAVLADPTLLICLENIVHANQQNRDRLVDMSLDGERLRLISRTASSGRADTHPPIVDRKRLAAGDDC